MHQIIATLFAGAIAAAPADAPLGTPDPVADRGEVKSGPLLKHTFTLTHGGSGNLLITGVEGSCGCVRTGASRTELRPGESSDIAVEINTLTQPEGENSWRVTVRYRADAPSAAAPPSSLPPPRVAGEHLLELRVVARVVRDVAVTPPSVAISTDGEAVQSLTVRDRRANPLAVVRVASSSRYLAATAGAAGVKAGQRSQQVTLKVLADAPAGHHDETLTLYTDDPAYPELRVPVRVSKRVSGAVAVSPDVVSLRFATGQAEASAVVVIRSSNGAPVRVARAESEDGAVKLKWSTDAGPAATVRVTAAAKPDGRAEVRVLMAEPAGHALTIPVLWPKD